LVTDKTEDVLDTPKTIQLRHDLFNKDALIFKDLKSRKVSLKSSLKGNLLTVHFKDFPYLGFWAKPNANYVCIEPWLGIADSEHTNQQLVEKEGIIKLEEQSRFEATYTIEIHKPHLV
jgi:galactose mutarotase-like enzyme